MLRRFCSVNLPTSSHQLQQLRHLSVSSSSNHSHHQSTPAYQAIARQVSDRHFDLQKKEILSDLEKNQNDHSIIGKVDPRILGMVNEINSRPDYFTTSSCSGRLSVFHRVDEEDKTVAKPQLKRGAGRGFLYVTHDPLETAAERDEACESILKSLQFDEATSRSLECPSGTVELKYEPLILHVRCRNLEASQKLLEAAAASGLRKSGMIAPSSRLPLKADERDLMRSLLMTANISDDHQMTKKNDSANHQSDDPPKREASSRPSASLLNYIYASSFLVQLGSSSGVNNICCLEGKMFVSRNQLRDLLDFFNDSLLMGDNEKKKMKLFERVKRI